MKRLVGVAVVGVVMAFAVFGWGAAWYQRFMPYSQSRAPDPTPAGRAISTEPLSKVRNFESVGSYINLKRQAILAVLQDDAGGTLLVGRSADDGHRESSGVVCIKKTGRPESCSNNSFTDSTGFTIPATRNVYLFVDAGDRIVGGAGLTDDQARIVSEKAYGGASLIRALTSGEVQKDLFDGIQDTINRGSTAPDIATRVATTASRVAGRAMDPRLIEDVIYGGATTPQGGGDKPGDKSDNKYKDLPCETMNAIKPAAKPDAGKGAMGTKMSPGDSGDSENKLAFSKKSQEFAQGQWREVCDRGASLMESLEMTTGPKGASPMSMAGDDPCNSKKPGGTKAGKGSVTRCGGNPGTGGAGSMMGDGGGNVLQTGDACGGMKALGMKDVAGAGETSKHLGSFFQSGEVQFNGGFSALVAQTVDVYLDPSDLFRYETSGWVIVSDSNGKTVDRYQIEGTTFGLKPSQLPPPVAKIKVPGSKGEKTDVTLTGKPGKKLTEAMEKAESKKKPPESKGPPLRKKM